MSDRPLSTAVRSAPVWRLAAFYGLTVAMAVALFFVIRAWGEQLPRPVESAAAQPAAATAPPSPAASTRPPAKHHPFPFLLAALAAVVLTGRLLGIVLGWIGQ